jgi:hypothetical protein
MLNTLTASEKAQLCTDVSTFFSSSAVLMSECRLSGVLSATAVPPSTTPAPMPELQTACTSTYDECIKPRADAGASATVNCDTSLTVPATCLATVTEYAACISDFPQSLGASAPACSTLTRASLSIDAGVSSTVGGLPTTSACNALVAKCPDVGDSTTALVSKAR